VELFFFDGFLSSIRFPLSFLFLTRGNLVNCHTAVIHIDYSRNMDELEVISALRALGEQTRWRVMRLLLSSSHGMAAGDIAEALKVRQNTLSSHIAALTRCGLVDGHRQGRKIVYSVDSRNARRLAAQVLITLGDVSESAARKLFKA
jgi:DNA-binding transcriptional ArsR family regulator